MRLLVEEIVSNTVVINITNELINSYISISGDDNPVHVSQYAANQAGFQDRVAHGMLTMFISTKIVSPLLIDSWSVESFTSKFLYPLYVNDRLFISGCVQYHQDGVLCIKVQAKNQHAEKLMIGKLVLTQKTQNSEI